VTQVSPVCDVIGRFSVRGKPGLNRVRFAGRIGRQQLGPGTYRISARTRDGSVEARVLLVVVSRSAPSGSDLAAARVSNVCSDPRSTADDADGSFGSGSLGSAEPSARPLTPQEQPAANPSGGGRIPPVGGVLARSVEEATRALQPILIALLAASILLLALASVPRFAVGDARVNDLLARHRLEIASLGASALIAFLITLVVF
jgi:hypothetical protein